MDNIQLKPETYDILIKHGNTDEDIQESIYKYTQEGLTPEEIIAKADERAAELSVNPAADVVGGLAQGLMDMVRVPATKLGRFIGENTTNKLRPLLGKEPLTDEQYQEAINSNPITGPLYKPKSEIGKALRQVSKYLSGSILGTVATGNPYIGGAVADSLLYEKGEGNLSSALVGIDSPIVNNLLTQALSIDKDDSEVEAAIKNAIEGLGIGATLDATFRAIKAVRNLKKAQKVDPGIKPSEEIKTLVNETADELKMVADDIDIRDVVEQAKQTEDPEKFIQQNLPVDKRDQAYLALKEVSMEETSVKEGILVGNVVKNDILESGNSYLTKEELEEVFNKSQTPVSVEQYKANVIEKAKQLHSEGKLSDIELEQELANLAKAEEEGSLLTGVAVAKSEEYINEFVEAGSRLEVNPDDLDAIVAMNKAEEKSLLISKGITSVQSNRGRAFRFSQETPYLPNTHETPRERIRNAKIEAELEQGIVESLSEEAPQLKLNIQKVLSPEFKEVFNTPVNKQLSLSGLEDLGKPKLEMNKGGILTKLKQDISNKLAGKIESEYIEPKTKQLGLFDLEEKYRKDLLNTLYKKAKEVLPKVKKDKPIPNDPFEVLKAIYDNESDYHGVYEAAAQLIKEKYRNNPKIQEKLNNYLTTFLTKPNTDKQFQLAFKELFKRKDITFKDIVDYYSLTNINNDMRKAFADLLELPDDVNIPIIKDFQDAYEKALADEIAKRGTLEDRVFNKLSKIINPERMKELGITEDNIKAFSNKIVKKLKDTTTPEEQKQLIRDYAKAITSHRKQQLKHQILKNADNKVAKEKALMNFLGQDLPAYYINNLLSSPTTHEVNFFGGLLQLALNPASKVVGGAVTLDKHTIEEGLFQAVGYIRALKDSSRFALKALKEEVGTFHDVNPFMEEISEELGKTPKAMESWGLLGTIFRLPSRLMITADEFLTQMNYRATWYAKSLQAAKEAVGTDDSVKLAQKAEELFKEGFNDVGKAVDKQSIYEAKKLVFTNKLSSKNESETLVTKFGGKIEKVVQENPGLRFFMPFIRTPMNIFQTSIEMSPAAIVQKRFWENIALGGRERSKTLGNFILGNAVLGYAYTQALSGNITGSPPADEKVRKALYATGWQPYSIVITKPDGTKVYKSYARIEPISSIMGIAADMANIGSAISQGDFENIHWKIISSIKNNTVNKVYLQELVRQMEIFSIDSIQDEYVLDQTLGNFASNMLPGSSFARWLNKDTEMTEAKSILDRVKQTYPFLDPNGIPLEPRRNMFGEIQHAGKNDWMGKFSFMRETESGRLPEDLAIQDLAVKGISIPDVAQGLHGNEINLLEFRDPNTKQSSRDAIREAIGTITLGGKTLRERLRDLVISERYQQLPDGVLEDEDQLYDSKARRIREIYQDYRDKALYKVKKDKRFINEEGMTLMDAEKQFIKSKRLSSYQKLNSQL